LERDRLAFGQRGIGAIFGIKMVLTDFPRNQFAILRNLYSFQK
jgi:hypothetical protein